MRFLLMLFMFLLPSHAALASDAVWFRLSDEFGKPISGPIYVYNGDIKFNMGKDQNPYPYGELAKRKDYLLYEIIVGENGDFGIKSLKGEPQSLVIIAGENFLPVQIEKSSDLGHSYSSDHIRFVVWEGHGSTRVKHNEIYDLMNWTVTRYFLDGGQETLPYERVIPLIAYYKQSSKHTEEIAPRLFTGKTRALSQEQIGRFLGKLEDTRPENQLDLSLVHSALSSDHYTVRALAATYLGEHGDYRSIPYLINALSDMSSHVGADYADAGMATTRHRAHLSLKKLTGENFGYDWSAAPDTWSKSIGQWINWYKRSEQAVKAGIKYAKEQKIDLSASPKRILAHRNTKDGQWRISFFAQDPKELGGLFIIVLKDDMLAFEHVIRGR